MHEDSCFVTLTYRLPSYGGLHYGTQTLDPKHTQDWLKRLRRFTSLKLRYFLVGEYGDNTQRPHYHAALFGLPWGPNTSEIVTKTWGLGHTHVGDLTKDSAAYVAGYVTKKMTKKDDPRLGDRYPEFARMSLRPGIGALSIPVLEQALTTDNGANEIIKLGDVPKEIQYGKKRLPLGRYLAHRLRTYLGFPVNNPHTGNNMPLEQQILWRMQMQELLKEACGSEALPSNPEFRREAIKKVLVDINKQRVLNMETRQKIHSKKGQL